ncbi:hypothetical protein IAU60_004014 [Kwoniella sp. DSM 27419]
MEVTPEQLAREIVQAYKGLQPDHRLLVAVAGPPGSGKSTLAYPLTDHLNRLILNHAPSHPSHIEAPQTLELAEADKLQGGADEVAICVGLDGWHHTRAELDRFDDSKEAHWRRGAAFTFNQPAYHTFVQALREPTTSPSAQSIPFPTFDHALKDPQPSPVPILPRHRIIVIEGLYTMLDRDGWRDTAQKMDLRVWVGADPLEARARVIRRNFEAGIVPDLKACEERVDAVDMANAAEVRDHRFDPTYTIHSVEGQPFSVTAFE